MARKASDLFSLLAARTSHRRGGLLGQVVSILGSLFRGKKQPGPRRVVLSSFGFLAVCFGCTGIGYLIGDQFPMKGQALRMASPEAPRKETAQRPGPVDSPSKAPTHLANTALFIGRFVQLKQPAEDLARWLKSRGVESARALQVPNKQKELEWVVIAYYDGESQQKALQSTLRSMTPPSNLAEFAEWQKQPQWPIPFSVPPQ